MDPDISGMESDAMFVIEFRAHTNSSEAFDILRQIGVRTHSCVETHVALSEMGWKASGCKKSKMLTHLRVEFQHIVSIEEFERRLMCVFRLQKYVDGKRFLFVAYRFKNDDQAGHFASLYNTLAGSNQVTKGRDSERVGISWPPGYIFGTSHITRRKPTLLYPSPERYTSSSSQSSESSVSVSVRSLSGDSESGYDSQVQSYAGSCTSSEYDCDEDVSDSEHAVRSTFNTLCRLGLCDMANETCVTDDLMHSIA
jgi:hypothetical protein